PKATRGGRVQAELLVQFGDAQTLRGQRVNASAVADLLERGTDKLSRQEIQYRFDAMQAQVSFQGSGTDLSVWMSTAREHLPALVGLGLAAIRNATFPADHGEEYQRQALTSIRSAMTEPTAPASSPLAPHDSPWPADDVRYVPTFEEALADAEKLDLKALVD